MREILFKAKRDGSGEWVEGCYAECKGKTFIGIGTSIGIDALIYYGNVNEEKGLWVGEKKDVTDMAIASVFEWFMNQMDGKEEFAISYPNVSEFTLKMVREER